MATWHKILAALENMSEPALPGVDETFAQQVTEFIEEYRPALKALAK